VQRRWSGLCPTPARWSPTTQEMGSGGVVREMGSGSVHLVKSEDCGLISRFVRGQNDKLPMGTLYPANYNLIVKI
jgi:hypothetical protein